MLMAAVQHVYLPRKEVEHSRRYGFGLAAEIVVVERGVPDFERRQCRYIQHAGVGTQR